MKIDEIRSRYPNPVTATDASRMKSGSDAYCVGGALCRVLNEVGFNFPDNYDLAGILRRANHRLNNNRAYFYAVKITDANDAGHFDSAWDWLGKALSEGEESHA